MMDAARDILVGSEGVDFLRWITTALRNPFHMMQRGELIVCHNNYRIYYNATWAVINFVLVLQDCSCRAQCTVSACSN